MKDLTIKEIRRQLEKLGAELPGVRASRAVHVEALKSAAPKSRGKKQYQSLANEKQGATLRETYKLDRRVRNLKTGEIFDNPRQMAVKGELSVKDKNKLRRELYSAAKQGEYPVVPLAGAEYQLVAGYNAKLN